MFTSEKCFFHIECTNPYVDLCLESSGSSIAIVDDEEEFVLDVVAPFIWPVLISRKSKNTKLLKNIKINLAHILDNIP